MKKTKSLVALLLVLCLAMTCFAGCGSETTQEPQGEIQQVTGTFSDSLMLEQIGIVDRPDFSVYGGGLVYKDSTTKKYGIMSVEGLFDSGALYDYVNGTGLYFSVLKNLASDPSDISGVNQFALVTGTGRQIIGPQYASYTLYGEFVIARKATKQNDKDGEVSVSTDAFKSDVEKTVRYESTWTIYSLRTGAKIPGLEGTGDFPGYDQGPYLCYNNGEKYVKVDAFGNLLPEDIKVFSDGSYSSEAQIGEVFAVDGSKLFSYDLTGYIPQEFNGEYYIASRYMDGVTKYVIMNTSGEIISTEFDNRIEVVGNLVLSNEILQNFEGKALLEGSCSSIKLDRIFGQYYVARTGDVYTMLDETGNVFLSTLYDDNHTFYSDDLVACDSSSGDYMYYNHKTQKYDIKGYSMSPWMVKVAGANYTYELVDTMTGDTLLSGYTGYSYNTRNPETYYIYAKHNAGADVFLATSTNGFKSVTEIKEDLFNDLSAAFEAEGLKVSVNRETGELALDASVLFGGDSSALTAEGKTFLNKFIKAYNSVAFSEKYADFISSTMIEGHTAPLASSTYASGLALSQERAENVKDYILSGETGVDLSAKADTFEAIGRSNSQPVYNDDGSVNMDASRRVSFRFLVNVNG